VEAEGKVEVDVSQ
jgi:hypothetical protein